MIIPKKAKTLINIIEDAGYEAFAVGGCVRDFIMHRPCDDIDITTSAKPYEVEKVLIDNQIRFIETGLKHGTVTVLFDNDSFEVTTYRTDGTYNDSRHPENVAFVSDIKEDLSRRDFTINALAYNSDTGFVDLFGGRDDIDKKIIRAVGNPDKRFKEDALRIIRAIRFASVLSFDIEPITKKALFDNKDLLKNISAERIYTELSKLLLGDNVFNVLCEYKEILGVVIPELKPIFNISQNTKWHIYNVWEHTAKAVEQSPKDLALRYAMLLHDIGKAYTKTTDENGTDHFKGHQKVSADYSDIALKRLKTPNEIFNRVMAVVPIHDMHIGTDRKKIKKWLSKLGENTLRDLIAAKRSDKLAQNPEMTAQELENLVVTEKELDSIINDGEPFTVKDLAINGYDLISLGYTGKGIGDTLTLILDKVISGELDNNKEVILSYLQK